MGGAELSWWHAAMGSRTERAVRAGRTVADGAASTASAGGDPSAEGTASTSPASGNRAKLASAGWAEDWAGPSHSAGNNVCEGRRRSSQSVL